MKFQLSRVASGMISLIGGWAIGSSAMAFTPQVKDHAGVLSSAAVAQISEQIKEIKKTYHKDLVIETLVPKGDLKNLDEVNSAAALAELGRKTVRRSGIEILILKSSDFWQVHVAIGAHTLPTFPLGRAQEIQERLRTRMSQGRGDEGLLETIGSIRAVLEEGQARKAARSSGLEWTGIGWFLLPVMPIWLALEVVRSVQRRHDKTEKISDNPYGAGGSILPGLFTAVAYQQFKHFRIRGQALTGGSAEPLPLAGLRVDVFPHKDEWAEEESKSVGETPWMHT